MSSSCGPSQSRESPGAPGEAFQGKPPAASKVPPRLIALLLALVTLLVYLPTAHDGFVNYDDNDYVTDNPAVRAGLTWSGLQWAFRTGHAGNWHPLTWLSHMLDCELFGLNPGAHHFVNVLFHVVNVVSLFALLWRWTAALWPSAVVAALFAWHPLRVESVAWISERKDVLSTFFGLLTLLAYARWVTGDEGSLTRMDPSSSPVTRHASRFYGLALLFFALGLMAKPMLVTLPFLLLLLDYWPMQRLSLRSPGDRGFNRLSIACLLFEKLPFFLLAAISCGVTFFVQRQQKGMIALTDFPAASRLANALAAYGRYLFKTIWPVDLAVIYPLSAQISLSKVAAALAVLIFLTAAAVWIRKRCPYFIVGWLWFLGTLVPVIGLVQVGIAALADRYTYFPLVGVFIMVAFGARDLVNRFPVLRFVVASAAVLVLTACLILTEHQLRFWRNSGSLFRHALAVTQDNGMAHLNLGVVCQETGRLREALAEYRAAAKSLPGYFQVHCNLGSVLDDLGQPEAALAEYRLALQLKPDLPAAHEGMGLAFVKLGRYAEAMNEFTNAAQLDPAYPWPYVQMGRVLLKQGRDAAAVEQFGAALHIDPDNVAILAEAARVLAADANPAVRDGRRALAYAARADALSNGLQPSVLDALGMACAEAGRFEDARAATEKAIGLARAAGMEQDAAAMQQRLELYRQQQPWRESFLATNAPPRP